MICIGIDPGKSGAAVALRDGKMKICRFDKDTEQDVAKWLEAIDTAASWRGEKVFCFIEKVQPLPSFGGPAGTGMRGSVASFKVGQSYGFLRGCLIAIGIPFEEVTGKKGQQVMGCRTKGDKNISKARAQQLWPTEKVIHQTADGMLIAEFCRRRMGGTV